MKGAQQNMCPIGHKRGHKEGHIYWIYMKEREGAHLLYKGGAQQNMCLVGHKRGHKEGHIYQIYERERGHIYYIKVGQMV